MISTTALNTGHADFLAWAEQERGTALPARASDAVLTLLALRGADRRAGVPEPTPQLVRSVLHKDLPVLLCATAAELDAVPDILRALADRVRAAGRLNTKRHTRLLAAIDEASGDFRTAMDDPWNLTWPRWYASLLRADGVDADDAEAVRAWLAAHDQSPHADRPALPEPLQRPDLTARTFAAREQLSEALLAAFARDAAGPAARGGALLPAPPLGADHPDDALAEHLDRIASALSDRWTAAGLGEALAGPYAFLAPGPEAMPHAALADRLLDEHLDYYGNSGIPLPPPPELPAPEEIRDLLHAAPLPAALAAGGDDLTDAQRDIAERCGFPEPAMTVWNEGTPQELTELAADLLAAVMDSMPVPDDPDQRYLLDGAHLLYTLYERGSTPDSVARKAADVSDGNIAPELEDDPVSVPTAQPAAYELPPLPELAAVLGRPDLTEPERAELDTQAKALAATVDRLGATGFVFRAGDAYGLTPLGSAVLRHILTVGHCAAPDQKAVAAWNAAETIEGIYHWPHKIAATALNAWAAARGGTDAAWSELLGAVSAAKSADFLNVELSRHFDHLDEAGVPTVALRTALDDPVTGAHAARLLGARGEAVPEEQVPPNARATLLLEDLDQRWIDDMRVYVAAAAEERDPDPLPTALLDAFDAAAATWPDGPAALVRALAAANPTDAVRILGDLQDRHPDGRVRDTAAHEMKSAKPRHR
ncbi:hypothetical protein ABZ208_17520 [Streptomyces sp. NPDC006208]|uniref:hypothetical protein n=1 Tax=Streptomyces sp. NPDC006208 TaxID=3156734 RepID=UPI0033BDCCB9